MVDEHDTERASADDSASRPGAERQPTLLVLSGPNVGLMYPLRLGTTSVGRDETCEIVIEDQNVSRRHSRVINIDNAACLLEDLGSTNGTFVNDRRIRRAQLRDGDRVRFAKRLVMKFVLADAVEEGFHRDMLQAALRDPLTSVYNRRYLIERMKSEISFARRHEQKLSFVLVDIDNFKQVNDTYGHQAGDEVLKHFVSVMARTLRLEDVLARYGGEEFGLICRGQGADQTLRLCERLREALTASPTPVGKQTISVTSSFGVTSFPEDATVSDVPSMIAAADVALLAAKRNGRNRTEVSFRLPAPTEGDHRTKPMTPPPGMSEGKED